MSPRGNKSPRHIVARRRKDVAALALQNLGPTEISRIKNESLRTIFRDLAALDLAADADIESVEMRKKLRTNELARLKEIERAVAESDQLCDADRIQAMLAVTDRRIRLGVLDDAKLLNGGASGEPSVIVNLQVEFE